MKNSRWSYVAGMVAALLFVSCGGQSKQKAESEMNTDSTKVAYGEVQMQKDSMLATLTLDGMKVTWIRDNVQPRLMPRTLFPDASDAQIDSLSLQNGVPASISTFLVEKDSVRMLFDTGMGAPDSRLLEGLKALHIHPEDINYLFITHFHGDHIGGMMKNDSVVFPRAEVYASQLEYDAWMKMPADQKAQVEKTMKAYKDRLHLFVFGDTLPENVMAMNAVGHTPGHTVFQVGKLLVIGDLCSP